MWRERAGRRQLDQQGQPCRVSVRCDMMKGVCCVSVCATRVCDNRCIPAEQIRMRMNADVSCSTAVTLTRTLSVCLAPALSHHHFTAIITLTGCAVVLRAARACDIAVRAFFTCAIVTWCALLWSVTLTHKVGVL